MTLLSLVLISDLWKFIWWLNRKPLVWLEPSLIEQKLETTFQSYWELMHTWYPSVEVFHAWTEDVSTDLCHLAIVLVTLKCEFTIPIWFDILIREVYCWVFLPFVISVLVGWEKFQKIDIIDLIMLMLPPVFKTLHDVILCPLTRISSQIWS